MTAKEIRAIVSRFQDQVHTAVQHLSGPDYLAVLEEFACEIEGRIDAYKEENRGDE